MVSKEDLVAAMAAAGLRVAPDDYVPDVPIPVEQDYVARGAALSASLGVPPHCQALHSLLLGLGLELFPTELFPTASQAVFFLPLELLAAAVKRHRSTVWRQVQVLERLGLVYHCPLVKDSTIMGRITVGTVWWVQLKAPGRPFILPEDFAADYRDIDADIANGDTAYAMQQSVNGVNYSLLKRIVLKGKEFRTRNMTVASEATVPNVQHGSVLEARHFEFETTHTRLVAPHIDALAQRIGRNFGSRYVPFWRGMLWRGLKTGRQQLVAALILEGYSEICAGSPAVEVSRRVGKILMKALAAGPSQQRAAGGSGPRQGAKPKRTHLPLSAEKPSDSVLVVAGASVVGVAA